MVGDALVSVEFANEVIVADTGSIDGTLNIAKEHGAKIIHSEATNYADFRNVTLSHATGDWVLFVDADERVTPLLKKEILEIVSEGRSETAYAIPRQNIFLGRSMSHGGWGNDYVIRLFKREHLKRYVGELHEQPEFTGDLGTLKNYFWSRIESGRETEICTINRPANFSSKLIMLQLPFTWVNSAC